MIDLTGIVQQVSVVALPLIFAITLHEAAHGYVAWAMGDDTARRLGRISLNPLRHVDPFGTIILPAMLMVMGSFLFGWAKPVPVNFSRLHHPRSDMVWVALAGPGTNFVLALVSAVLWGFTDPQGGALALWFRAALEVSILVNVILMVFNLIPLPPLDGGRVAVGVLPDALALPLARLERYGLLILIGAFFLLPMIGREIGVPLDVTGWVLGPPVRYAIELIQILSGNL